MSEFWEDFSSVYSPTLYHGDSFILLVRKEYILANIGGEFGMDGQFNVATQQVQDEIYKQWDSVYPALDSLVVRLLQEEQQ